MAVTKITCPECKTVLKPAKPVAAGKPVKCPECGNRFAAPAEAAEAPPAKPKKAPAAAAAAAKPKPKKAAEKKPAAPEKKPAAAKAGDDEDEGGVYGYVKEETEEEDDKPDIKYGADTSIKDLRGPAAAALVQPTNALLIVGGLGFFGWLALIVIHLVPVCFPIDNDEGDKTKPAKPVIGLEHALSPGSHDQQSGGMSSAPGGVTAADLSKATVPADPPASAEETSPTAVMLMLAPWGAARLPPAQLFLLLFLMVLGMIYSGFLTYGAVKIQQLEGYGWGVASCVLAMIPICNGWGLACCVWQLLFFLLKMGLDDRIFIGRLAGGLILFMLFGGMVIGGWVLTVLRSKTVIKGFEYKAE